MELICRKEKPAVSTVECKLNNTEISKSVKYFEARTDIPIFYQVHTGTEGYRTGNVRVLPFNELVKEVNLV